MPDVLAITGPVFLLIGLGFAAVRLQWFAATALPALGGFVLRFALPAMLFKAMVSRPFAELMNLRFLTAYAAGSLAVLAAGLAWARWARGQRIDAAAITAMGMSCANSALIGFPIVMQVVGPDGTAALAMALLVENILLLPLCLALADSVSLRHEPFWKAMAGSLAGLRRNPLMMTIAAGLLFALAGWSLPATVARAVDMLAGAVLASALFYIGGALVGLKVGALASQVAAVTLGKLVLHPLAVFAAVLALGPMDPSLQIAAVLIACAPMQGIYPILGHKYGQQGVAAASLLVGTTAAFFTLALAIWGLQASSVFGPLR